jgi:hypothetical protein
VGIPHRLDLRERGHRDPRRWHGRTALLRRSDRRIALRHTRRPFLASASLNNIQPFGDGSLLLITASDLTRNDVLFIDASGEIQSSSPLYAPGRWQHYSSLGASKNGPLFFVSSSVIDSWSIEGFDLYRFPMSGIAPVDPMAGELVSQKSLPQDRRRAARH